MLPVLSVAFIQKLSALLCNCKCSDQRMHFSKTGQYLDRSALVSRAINRNVTLMVVFVQVNADRVTFQTFDRF